jgi:hypothetical protein
MPPRMAKTTKPNAHGPRSKHRDAYRNRSRFEVACWRLRILKCGCRQRPTSVVDAFNSGQWERLKNLFDPAANIRGVLGWGRIS